jgi:hypothetical protein
MNKKMDMDNGWWITDIGESKIRYRYYVGIVLLSTISEVPVSGSVRYRRFQYQAQSDIGGSSIRLSPISEAPVSGSVRYRRFQYQAQSDIGGSSIRLSPISFIKDIGFITAKKFFKPS